MTALSRLDVTSCPGERKGTFALRGVHFPNLAEYRFLGRVQFASDGRHRGHMIPIKKEPSRRMAPYVKCFNLSTARLLTRKRAVKPIFPAGFGLESNPAVAKA